MYNFNESVKLNNVVVPVHVVAHGVFVDVVNQVDAVHNIIQRDLY